MGVSNDSALFQRPVNAGIALAATVLVLCGCEGKNGADSEVVNPLVRLATNTTTVDSGLLAELLPDFESQSDYRVEVLSLGTGASLAAGRNGEADIILAHAREAEAQFINEGHGINRREIMYNDFVIAGPPNDPAMVRGLENAADALRRIADSNAAFVARGGSSGTYMRELALWREADVEPPGEAYHLTETGMLETLRDASDAGAYVLCDRGTFLSNGSELDLEILVEGDTRLRNNYSVIVVNPIMHPEANIQGAMALFEYFTSQRAQDLIRSYGVEEFGVGLFTPIGRDRQ